MILVDTSIWIDHFRRRNETLAAALERGEVATHPFVIGELILGGAARTANLADLLEALPAVTIVEHDHVIALVRDRALARTGIGWVDVHLLASSLVDRVPLWTRDNRLGTVAGMLSVSWHG